MVADNDLKIIAVTGGYSEAQMEEQVLEFFETGEVDLVVTEATLFGEDNGAEGFDDKEWV